jgi:hypothetical protein
MPPAQAMMFESMLEGLDIQSKSCLAVAGSAADGKVNIHATLPKEHLGEIMNLAMQIQAKVQKQMMEQMQNMQQNSEHQHQQNSEIPVPAI